MDYNTQRKQITLKEYGRNIQCMVENLVNVEDRNSRSIQAKNLVELMKQFIQPGGKDNNDLTHKVWDDLFIISDFKLDVECPFPKPDVSVITKRPQPLSYQYSQPKFKHYGRNLELLIKKISEIETPEEKENAVIYVGRLMKTFYSQYNKDVVEDEVIKEQLEKISSGKIVLDLERIKSENLFEQSVKDRKSIGISNNNNMNIDRNNDRRNNNMDRNGKNKNNQKRRRK